MAKSTHRLVFRNEKEIPYFSKALLSHLKTHGEWLRECDFFKRGNILYVDTKGYSMVVIFLESMGRLYDYECVDLRKVLKDVKNKAKVCKLSK